jgi:hypothetical protein
MTGTPVRRGFGSQPVLAGTVAQLLLVLWGIAYIVMPPPIPGWELWPVQLYLLPCLLLLSCVASVVLIRQTRNGRPESSLRALVICTGSLTFAVMLITGFFASMGYLADIFWGPFD